MRVAGVEGPLALSAAGPFAGCLKAEPAPKRCVLSVNGKDFGREILARLPGVRRRREEVASFKPIQIADDGTATWEAEAGLTFSGMTVEQDDEAFGSRFAWVPGEPGAKGGIRSARVIWKLMLPKEGTYYLWGRVKAPTPDDDSFFVSVSAQGAEPVAKTDWHTGVHTEWEWTPITFDRSRSAAPIRLPKGQATLELRCREDGTAVDRLYITSNPDGQPR